MAPAPSSPVYGPPLRLGDQAKLLISPGAVYAINGDDVVRGPLDEADEGVDPDVGLTSGCGERVCAADDERGLV